MKKKILSLFVLSSLSVFASSKSPTEASTEPTKPQSTAAQTSQTKAATPSSRSDETLRRLIPVRTRWEAIAELTDEEMERLFELANEQESKAKK